MKVLITGDRNWDDVEIVVRVLETLPSGTILINGACRGADTIARAVGDALGFTVRSYPADWNTHKRAAGPIRNRQMLSSEHTLDEPFDMCIAFHGDITKSSGTIDMMRLTSNAGIFTTLVSSGDFDLTKEWKDDGTGKRHAKGGHR